MSKLDDCTVIKRQQILDAASKCICQDRSNQYGAAENNFTDIANYWTLHLRNKLLPGQNIDAVDVAVMQTLLKIARIEYRTDKADSWIDAAGYLACGAELAGAG